MKAVQLHAYGGVEQLFYEDVPDPKPGNGEVLVKVAATSINPVDWKLRRGDLQSRMPLELPAVLGRDVAGTVAAVGSGADGFRVGAKVMGLVNRAYADYLVAKAETLIKIPKGLDIQEAAALPLVTLTGAQLIEKGVQPKAGQTVLITGAAGSVGRSAVYVARQHGAKVIAGVRESQRKDAKNLQADQVVAIDSDSEIAALGQVDAVADTVGGSVTVKLLPHLRDGGVLATVVGAPEGMDAKKIHVQQIFTQVDASQLQSLAKAAANHRLVIPIERRMKLSEIRQAQAVAEAGGVGKIVLVP